MKKLTLIVLAAFFTSACSIYHITSEDTSTEYHASKKTASEVVFLDTIDRPHEAIGQVTVNTERRQRLSEVMAKIKREAAILGGDAITNIQTDATGAWKKLPAQDFIGNGYVRANFSATVIVFK